MVACSRKRPEQRTIVLLTIAVLSNSFGNLLLSLAVKRLPQWAGVDLMQFVWSALHDPLLLPGALLTAIYALVQVSLFTWADLSFVVPCIASSYIVSTLLAEFALGERVALVRWLGVSLIWCGVILVARTPQATKPHDTSVRA